MATHRGVRKAAAPRRRRECWQGQVEARVFVQRALARAAGPPAPARREAGARPHLLEAAPDGGQRHPRGAAPLHRPGLRGCPQPPGALRQDRHERLVVIRNGRILSWRK